MNTKYFKKKAFDRIICIWIIILFILNCLVVTINVSAISTTITADSGSVYGVAYSQTRNLARGKNQWIHAAWKQTISGGNQIYYSKTTDNGSTWSSPVALTSIPTTWTVGETSPSILVDSHQKLWIFYDTKDVASPNKYNISYITSTDNGTTWSAISNAYSVATYTARSVSTVLDSMDNIHLAFLGQYYGGSWIEQVRYIKYTHSTGTWSLPINITAGAASSDRTQIEIDNSNNLHVVWLNVNGLSKSQVMYEKYTNASSTWGSAYQVSTDQTSYNSEHPFILANGSYVNVFWYAIPNGDTTRRIRSRYYNGSAWSSTTNISSSLSGHSYSENAAYDIYGNIYLTFFFNPSTRDIYFSKSTDHGATWSAPSDIVTDATEDRYPQMLYARYPKYDTNYTNVPKGGYAFVWMATNAIHYFSSSDLAWQPLVTPPPAPPSSPHFPPTINFITPPSTINGSKTSTSNCYIRADINSSSGNTSNIHNNTNETLRPTSCWDTYYNDYTGQNGATYKCIDDAVPDGGEFPTNSGSFIYKSVETDVVGSAKWDTPSSVFDSSYIVGSLTYTMTAGTYGATGGGFNALPVDVYLDLNISNHWYETPTYVQRIVADATWYTFSYTWYNNPATGLNWTIGDINNLFYGMRNKKNGADVVGSLDTTQCYVTLKGIHSSKFYSLLNLKNDLVTWLTFSDQTGGNQPHDISGYNNDGTKQGGAYIDGYGMFGKELWGDGYNDYIQIPTSASMDSINDTATVSFWARSYEDYGSFPQSNRGLFGFYQNANNRIYICIHTADQKVEVYSRLGSVALYKTITDSTLTGNYITSEHFYTITFNTSYVACYIDGIYKGRAAFETSWPSLSSLIDGFVTNIGRGSSTGTTYDWYGSIDEFMIFKRQLAVDEIQALYDGTTYQYDHNFTSLSNANYTFQGIVSNSIGARNQTEIRWANLQYPYPPVISDVSPANNSVAQPYPTLSIKTTDNNNDLMRIYWSTNSTGSWIIRHVDTGVTSGSTNTWTDTYAKLASTSYYWKVSVNDSTYNITEIYKFTTMNKYFVLKGLHSGGLDWTGLPGSYYWSNSSGSGHETLDINMTFDSTYSITNIGIWAGDLLLTFQEDLTDGWNYVTFPNYAIDACLNDDPEVVLDSVHDYLINVTEISTGKYWNRTGTPTLIHILPALQYKILVNSSCQIYISSPLQINASNISVQFSSNNITWGGNTRSFIDGGSIVMANSSTWTNANGCYGTNPFPIGAGSTDIYARFKLRFPSNMPSDYLYLSLSSSDWKVYIYSGISGPSDPIIPPYTPTIPTTGDFSLKWSNVTMPFMGADEPVAKDVDGDGIMEIFWAGDDSPDTPTIQYLMCINSSTGKARWSHTWSSNFDIHNPVIVYDFDKDGDDEVFMTRNTGGNNRFMLFNAKTGTIEWNVSSGSPSSVQHHMGYIDNGDIVYIYTAGSDAFAPYDAKVCKINGYNGTIVKTASTFYSCYGGTSIADLDGDGKYEIIITDRGQDNYPGTPAKSVRCYDEDLNLLWYATYPTCSSHCAMLIDVNGDGKLEVVIGRQNSGNSGIYVYNYDGSIWKSSASISGWYMHVQPSVGDIDGDGHIEMIDGFSSYWHIFDLTNWAIEYSVPVLGYPTPTDISEPPDIGNVIYDSGLETDNRLEVIAARGDYTYIVKYNYTTSNYEIFYRFPSSTGGSNSIVTDFDHDGFNELLLSGGHTATRVGKMWLYETKVPSYNPLPRTNLAHDGERRQSNGLYYPHPYTGADLYSELGFGGTANLTGYTPDLFITDCVSNHNLIEYNGYYGLGNYTATIDTTLFLPAPWSLNSMYIRVLNATSGVQYDNLTYGFTVTGSNTTNKIYTKIYNPSVAMNGIKDITLDVHVTINYGGLPVFSGNRSFPGLFRIYDINGPTHETSKYDTTTNALNLTWSSGNYTDLYVVVRKSGVNYPTSPLDGTIVQNNTHLYYVEAGVLSSRAYSIFGYNRTSRSYSEALNIPWGAIRIDVHDENNATKRIHFNLLVSNRDGSQTYTKSNIIGPYYLDLLDIPYGPQTVFIISNTTYRQRTYYEDLYANTFYNFSFYLPPVTPGGGSTPEENQTQLYLFTVYNRYQQTLQDVKIDVRRYIDTTDSYESVGILLTDAAGQADIFLIPYKLYQFVVSKSGFITATSYWTPTPLIQTHTFILDYEIPVEPTTINPFDVITFTAGFPLNNVTLSVDVDDSTGNLTDATIYIYENSILIYSINFSSTPFHLDYTHNATSPNNNLSEYIVVLEIRNHSEFPNNGNYNFTIIIQKSNPHGLLLNLDIDLTGILGDPGSGIGVHVGWINIFILGLGVFVIVSFGRYWAGIGIVAMGLVIGLMEFAFGLPGFTGIQLVSFIAYCIIMGALVEIGKAKQGRVGY